ncbi:hypothetical protein PACTADRAFT_85600 [Pachysolen tannophilus NRRL Y-2460]|uniref:Uncharacterized protein n=1 Tax=Pachysolen tannophilus NRRL Y-2460 TaxID=669874 RepID=A0A1E4TUV7_PACTA|nr:hypothetical protein PACTADRAFT_85600 [Pachysolen tannophilus NRRL Y-2460]
MYSFSPIFLQEPTTLPYQRGFGNRQCCSPSRFSYHSVPCREFYSSGVGTDSIGSSNAGFHGFRGGHGGHSGQRKNGITVDDLIESLVAASNSAAERQERRRILAAELKRQREAKILALRQPSEIRKLEFEDNFQIQIIKKHFDLFKNNFNSYEIHFLKNNNNGITKIVVSSELDNFEKTFQFKTSDVSLGKIYYKIVNNALVIVIPKKLKTNTRTEVEINFDATLFEPFVNSSYRLPKNLDLRKQDFGKFFGAQSEPEPKTKKRVLNIPVLSPEDTGYENSETEPLTPSSTSSEVYDSSSSEVTQTPAESEDSSRHNKEVFEDPDVSDISAILPQKDNVAAQSNIIKVAVVEKEVSSDSHINNNNNNNNITTKKRKIIRYPSLEEIEDEEISKWKMKL